MTAALCLTLTPQSTAAPEESDPLAEMGWEVTQGAAPGYIDDEACAFCHDSIATSYQEVAMSKAFYPPSGDSIIEKLGQPFLHRRSNRYYEMSHGEAGYRFKRYQVDDAGKRINVIEQQVDWILGSGNHSRTYLFRAPGGELFQLPLAWYSQGESGGSWGMAPGYDRPHHLGIERAVRRECMFCHNSYPEVPVGGDAYDRPHVFPEKLPSGLGCQRCHGPGARHVRAAFSDDLDPDEIFASIVNPANLEPRLRDDVCYGCHLQPSVALSGVRRFARTAYSFRPGQPLADYRVAVDVDEAGRERADRFEINHHPYRLEQSRCFTESEQGLSCLTCHDPHEKLPAAEQPAWYRSKCLSCHDLAATTAHAAPEEPGHEPGQEPGDCIPCHMPERRTQDVVRVTMTDHRIQRGPIGPELLAPREEHKPALVDVSFLYPHLSPTGELGEIYRAATVTRAYAGASASDDAVRQLEQMLAKLPIPQIEPWLDLARGQLNQERLEEVETTAEAVLVRSPGHPLALEWLGLARGRRGEIDAGIELLRRAASAPHQRPEVHYNLGLFLAQSGDFEEALTALGKAIEARPNMSAAWFSMGRVQRLLERATDAVASFRRTLEIDPSHERAYVALAEALAEVGEADEALRYLRHGARVARNPRPVAEALEQAEAARPPANGT